MIRNLDTITQTSKDLPKWFNDLRTQGLSQFQALGIPTLKDEEWKYTNLLPLTKHTFELIDEDTLIEEGALHNYCRGDQIKVVLVNGVLSKTLSNLNKFPSGITVSPLYDAITNNTPRIQELLTKYDENKNPTFTALNEAVSHSGIYIQIDDHIASGQLIHIVHVTSSRHQDSASMPRTLISVGNSGEATILESHVAFNDHLTYFTNALTDIFLGPNATLHYCKSQKESLKAFHIGHTRVWQEQDSNFEGFSFMVGSKLTRNNLDVTLNGEGANTVLNALYSVYNDQHADNHTSVDHRAANCTSNQLYKGILNNSAHAVFNGKVFVRPEAQKTNSYQLNQNLLLGTDCRVDTKPQLEIFADDVKCTHGATIGQLEKDEMFYLQTRSIPKKTATQMLAHGFVNDLLNTIKNKNIREKLDKLMEPSFEALK